MNSLFLVFLSKTSASVSLKKKYSGGRGTWTSEPSFTIVTGTLIKKENNRKRKIK